MLFTIIILSISFLGLLILYLREHKENKNLREQLSQLKVENATLQQKAKLSDDLKQILNGQIAEYLSSTNQYILNQAKNQIQDELFKHQANLEKIIVPFKQIIDRYDQAVKNYFEKSTGKFGNLDKALEELQKTSEQLKAETSNLVQVFKNSRQRGVWGEMQLQRLLEFAGLQKDIHFFTQKTTKSNLRPDYIINLPGGRKIVIDVKTPLDDYLRYVEATDQTQKKKYTENYVTRIRKMFGELSKKDYRQAVEASFDYVILYIPLESAFSLAINTDAQLFTDALKSKILLASPTTLLPILQMINLLWQQSEAAKNVQEIIKNAQILRDRYAVLANHLKDLGTNLNKSVDAYNNFINSWNTRFVKQIQKLEQLGVKSQKNLPELNSIDEKAHNSQEF